MPNWMYKQGDHTYGPVSSSELKQLAIADELKPDDLLQQQGSEKWTHAKNVKGLFHATQPVPPPMSKQLVEQPVTETTAQPERAVGHSHSIARKYSIPLTVGAVCVGIAVVAVLFRLGSDSRSGATTMPDFSRLDYSVPYGDKDTSVDFETVNYDEGPNGEPVTVIEEQAGVPNPQYPEDEKVEVGGARLSGYRRTQQGFRSGDGGFVRHGFRRVYLNDVIVMYDMWFDRKRHGEILGGQMRVLEDDEGEYLAGDLIAKSFAVDGKQHGREWFYFEDGSVSQQRTFVNGELHGIEEVFFRSGKLKLKKQYFHGQAHGTETELYEAGGPYLEKHFVEDKAHGKETAWYETGNKKYEGSWANGREHGQWQFFDGKGNVTTEHVYDDGVKREHRNFSPEGVLLREELFWPNGATQSLKIFGPDGKVKDAQFFNEQQQRIR